MFESDTGYRWLRITHYLKANIAHGDVVTFDLAFMTKNDPWTDPKNDMIEDSARCTLLQDSNDDRFWSTTVADYYNQCDTANCSLSTLTTAVWRSGTYTSSADTTNDWVVGITDDDPNDRFCTPVSPVTTDGTDYSEAQF